MECPKCAGRVRFFSETEMFCLDCDWDTLGTLDFHSKTLDVDAEWYTKTQLIKYRRWRNSDFQCMPPDWKGAYGRGYPAYYFHRETVEAHEATLQFQVQVSGWKRPQVHVPADEKITELAWRVCVRGEELLQNGWTYEMIDKLTPYRPHRWRKKRLFRLCDLSKVSETFRVVT